jgi:hypothetical protein
MSDHDAATSLTMARCGASSPVARYARRDIAAGEELTFDYALCTVNSAWHIDPCACGSPLCRRRVTGDDWRRKDLQQRYAGHFSPFINERIAREPA